jgi:hypothetical protein
MSNDEARTYAVRRAQQQNPHLEIRTWDELMALSPAEVSMKTFNELLESGLVEHRLDQHKMQTPPEPKRKKR